jgi:hypothetical protein
MKALLYSMVKPETFRTFEGTARIHAQRMRSLDWFAAGAAGGLAPDEWDLTEYGRNTMIGYLLEGEGFRESVALGLKAMYKLSWGDISDAIFRPAAGVGTEMPVWLMQAAWITDHNNGMRNAQHEHGYDEVEIADMIERTLEGEEQRAFLSWYLGFSAAEGAEILDVGERTYHRRLAEAKDKIRKVFV